MQRQSDSCRHLQSTGLDHLKCCSGRCIQFDGHSSLGWWMNRRVEEDMVNVAPNPCVPFYFLSPAIAKPDPGQSLQLKLKVTEAMNRPLWFLCVSFVPSASSGHRNLVLLLLFATLFGTVVVVLYVNILHALSPFGWEPSTVKWCANRQSKLS